MKKIILRFGVALALMIMVMSFSSVMFATSDTLSVTPYSTGLQETNELEVKTNSELVNMKNKAENELKEYEEKYGSKTYGYTAYILNKIRIFSIPLCFIGIAVGSIYQYVIGIRKMDVQDKGFALIIGFVTVLVICQVLPLIFAIVVQGWRG